MDLIFSNKVCIDWQVFWKVVTSLAGSLISSFSSKLNLLVLDPAMVILLTLFLDDSPLALISFFTGCWGEASDEARDLFPLIVSYYSREKIKYVLNVFKNHVHHGTWPIFALKWITADLTDRCLFRKFRAGVYNWPLLSQNRVYTITWLLCALSLVVDRDLIKDTHKWRQIASDTSADLFSFFHAPKILQ